jgi:hypothetical protein
MRRAAKVDVNQPALVKALREIPGVTVETGHDDIMVGYRGNTYWFEVKTPDTVSPRTGKVRPSEITPSERDRVNYWQGHYSIVWSLDQILEEIGI